MPELPPPVRKAIDAANSADTAAFSSLFTPEAGLVNDRGREFRGAHAIRRWSDTQFIGNNVKINVMNFHVTDARETVVIADATDATSNGAATYTFGVDGDRLTKLRIVA